MTKTFCDICKEKLESPKDVFGINMSFKSHQGQEHDRVHSVGEKHFCAKCQRKIIKLLNDGLVALAGEG